MKFLIRFRRNLDPWQARLQAEISQWKQRLTKHFGPWIARLRPSLERGKNWAARGMDWIAPDWNRENQEKILRLMLEKLYRDLGGAAYVMAPERDGEAASIGIISPVDAGFVFLNEILLQLSPFEWKQERDSLDMSQLANLPERFDPRRPKHR